MHVIKNNETVTSNADISVVIDDKIQSTEDLFNLLNKSLAFPSYFGFNWNALVDVMSDLKWLEGKTIAIIVRSISNLPKNEVKNLIEILAMTDKEGPASDRKPISSVNVYFTEQVVDQLNSINPKWVYSHPESGL
jgi:RNAse (barnase) inhibitor barstar